MDYTQLMKECKAACRERNACQEGYADLLRAENVVEILNVAVRNWNDVYRSKYADIVADNIIRWFDGLEKDFHEAGIFVNEETRKGIVIVSNAAELLTFGGNARIYVFGDADIEAYDNCEVYCRCSDATIELHDYASGVIERGKVYAYDWSSVESHEKCFCYDYSSVVISKGICHDKGHRRLSWSENVTIIKE